jgi:hypothetical protein
MILNFIIIIVCPGVVDDPASFLEVNLSQMSAHTIYRGLIALSVASSASSARALAAQFFGRSKSVNWKVAPGPSFATAQSRPP